MRLTPRGRTFVESLLLLAAPLILFSAMPALAEPIDTLWFDDALPRGAAASGASIAHSNFPITCQAWNWTPGDPARSQHWLPGLLSGGATPQARVPLPFSGCRFNQLAGSPSGWAAQGF